MSEADGNTGELRDIAYNVECLLPVLDRIATALERMAPQGSERERIALELFVHNPRVEADAAFRQADAWIAERDEQRAQQGGRTSEQA